MNFQELSRALSRRRRRDHAAIRRNPSCFRPRLEGLEERLALSHSPATTAPLHVAAQVQAGASQQIAVPIHIDSIHVANVSRDATSGILSLTGTVTGTILGQGFTSPMTGTVTPGHGARGAPVLNLDMQSIQITMLGLSVKTGEVRFNLNARNGSSLRAGLNDALASAATGASPLTQTTNSLNGLLGGSNTLNALNSTFGREHARLTKFTPPQGNSVTVLDLSLGSVRSNQQGQSIRLDNGQRGPVVVTVTATKGAGLLGDLVQGLNGNAKGRALNAEVAQVFQKITATPVPILPELTPIQPILTTPTSPLKGAALADPTLIQLDLKPLDVNLLGLEVKTSEIIVTVSAQPGSGKLLGNLLTTVANLINLQGVNNALNSVLGNVVTLANAATLNVSGVNTGGSLGSTTTATTTPVLTAHIAPVHLDLLGAVVDTSPIDLSIVAHSGKGLVLGNVVADLANLLNTPPEDGRLSLKYIDKQLQSLNNQLNAQIPGISPAPIPTPTTTPGTTNVLSLTVAPINLNLLGLVLKTDTIQVNADAQSGNGLLLGNLVTDLLNTLDATPADRSNFNAQVNALLAKVVGVLNATSLTLPSNAVSSLSQTLQTLALPNLINTTGSPATAPVLDLNIASKTSSAPPIDVNLLGLVITTSDVHAQLIAQTGDGQILGNLVYNVSHLLDPGGALGLLTILNALSL